jgi:uncharacterized membrane protein YeiH
VIAQMTGELVVGQLMPTWADVAAISLGAVSGSIVARRWGADILGILLIAVVSGLGGGFIRDLLLNRLPVALTNEVLIPTALVAALVGFLFADVTSRLRHRLDGPILVTDALFLGTYAIIGTEKALLMDLPAVSCVFVGTLAGVGGGLLRDVLINRPPEILMPGALNAVAAVVGCSIYATLTRNADLGPWVGVASIGVIVVLRLASVRFGWRTPVPRDLLTESRPGRFMADRIGLERLLPPEQPPDQAPDDPLGEDPPRR